MCLLVLFVGVVCCVFVEVCYVRLAVCDLESDACTSFNVSFVVRCRLLVRVVVCCGLLCVAC